MQSANDGMRQIQRRYPARGSLGKIHTRLQIFTVPTATVKRRGERRTADGFGQAGEGSAREQRKR
jgi:hypothetical protein